MKKYVKKAGVFTLLLITMVAWAKGNPETEPLTITILHINDTHSHLEPINYDLMLGGENTRVQLGGFPQLVSAIHQQEEKSINPILLHAGDALVGTIYYSLFQGKSDADVLNLLDFDAFVLGNHEFDGGNEVLKNFLDDFRAPVVAANVIAEQGSILQDKWTPYKIIEVDGQQIGIIGIDIVGKTKNSSSPGKDITFKDEYETSKEYADMLTKQGINKIIVLTHIGHENAKKLATTVSNIDIIVTGDSHSLLGGKNISDTSLIVDDAYPTLLTSPSNEPVAVIQAWEYAKILGKLEVHFDKEGRIISTTGNPLIIISDSFKRKNSEGTRVELEGVAREAVYEDIKNNTSLLLVSPDTDALNVVNKYQTEKEKQGKEVIGSIAENIPGGSDVRIPKESQGGHFTAQIVAEGTYQKIKSMGTGQIDGVIQNAGGVRIPLVQGDINTEIVYTLLPFSNTIMTIEITGQELKTALEQGVDYALNPNGSTGSFPYTAGFRYTADLKASNGNRISNIEFNKNGTWTAVNPSQTYTIGVNNYIAGGKDGYFILGEIDKHKKVDLYLNDAEVFTEYVKNIKTLRKPAVTNVTLK